MALSPRPSCSADSQSLGRIQANIYVEQSKHTPLHVFCVNGEKDWMAADTVNVANETGGGMDGRPPPEAPAECRRGAQEQQLSFRAPWVPVSPTAQ